MTILTIRHVTEYCYARPVWFGEHRMMFRPRDSHELRVLDTRLAITPAAQVRWIFDVFGNSIGIASFAEPADRLCFESAIRVEHFPTSHRTLVLEPFATHYPFSYAAEEIPDLGRLAERHYPDPDHAVDLWARRFVQAGGRRDTLALLTAMNTAIQHDFTYVRRDEEGTQTPVETLVGRSGSCRDFALLMMEAVRSLGFAARFVSGYLYDSRLVGDPTGRWLVGGGATHAWLAIYLPGAGWVEFDPTNGIVGGENLIRVAVARDPSQVPPLSGNFLGDPADAFDMTVDVAITADG